MKIRRMKDVRKPVITNSKRKSRLKKVLRFLKYMLVTALFATTVVYAAISPFFNIKKITAKESAHYGTDELIGASGIRKGINGFRLLFGGQGKIFLFRIGIAENAIIEKCPYVKKAVVRYVIPSTVVIEVEERQAGAILRMDGVDLLIDREGYLLEIDPDLDKTDLPVIKGVEPESLIPGKKLNINKEILLSAFKVFDTIREVDELDADKLLPDVDYINVADLQNVSFSLQSRVIVNLGKLEDLHYKISAAKTIFARNIKKSERGKLDFSTGSNPVFSPENGG
ncbi:MAG: cell division protein FtsQ/DivIB [Bacillota bacterium]